MREGGETDRSFTELRRNLRSRALFARSMLARPREVGAVWPTSRRAVAGLLEMADLRSVRIAVEFGAGTGVYTRGILDRMGPEGRLLAFEQDGDLARALAEGLPDPRLRVVHDSAERVEEYLRDHAGGERAGVIVSSVPFTTLPAGVREGILDAAVRALSPEGTMLVLQYSNLVRPALERRFRDVRRRLSPLNLPPAFLFACTGPRKESP